jgi:Asp-tRNA(Asn)/Glu-tRNA(Gln) amidotransferase A subunit family amidase
MLRGVPVGVKDIFNTADMPTQMGSRIWSGFRPGNDARVVFNLRYDGAIVPGKTQTSEFAVHEPTEVRNPRHLEHAPGTSSAGSAAAVAAGMVPLALGSQTAGSCIRPASYCGVFGFKPTFGAVPRTGVLKTADTLDTIAWFARSIDDVERLFEVVRVRGRNYPYVDANLVRRRPLDRPIAIAVVRGPHWPAATPAAQHALTAAADRLRAAGGRFLVDDLDLPEAGEIYDDHELIYCKALAYYFRGEQRNDRSKISGVLMGMLERGEATTPDAYHRAVSRQAELTRQLDDRFRHDAYLTLSAAGEAPRGLQSPDLPDTSKIWTYLGMPALSVPAASGPNGLPIGLQVVGPKYADYRVLDVGRAIVDALGVRAGIASPQQDARKVSEQVG